MKPRRCWAVTEGHIGMVNQALGLAEAIRDRDSDWTIEQKATRLRFPFTHLPPTLCRPPLTWIDPASDRLDPPWPDLMITCGRRSTGLSLAVRAASHGACLTVHIQDPLVDPSHFDLVFIPKHDRMRRLPDRDNVRFTRLALHRVTEAKTAAAAAELSSRVSDLPRPLVAVLIGGNNKRYRLTAKLMEDIAGKLAAMAERHGAGLLVTTSRRTGAENETILRRALAGTPSLIWDGTGENPYFGYLGLADTIVATADSVSMVSEACSTGKPVYVIDLEGGSPRFDAFHAGLRADGMTRAFDGTLEHWLYTPPADTPAAAETILRCLSAARPQPRGDEAAHSSPSP